MYDRGNFSARCCVSNTTCGRSPIGLMLRRRRSRRLEAEAAPSFETPAYAGSSGRGRIPLCDDKCASERGLDAAAAGEDAALVAQLDALAFGNSRTAHEVEALQEGPDAIGVFFSRRPGANG